VSVIVLHALFSVIGFAALVVSAGFSAVAFLSVVFWCAWFAGRRPAAQSQPPVTILKPLCGVEPGLYSHLRSFCLQQYPSYQIVFGVRDPADPALHVVERIVAEFPQVSIDVVVDPQLHGDNYKTSNLINMLRRARHDTLVIADSDAVVGADYLSVVTAPLLERDVHQRLVHALGDPRLVLWPPAIFFRANLVHEARYLAVDWRPAGDRQPHRG
jgi:ceramide glucosyltransferase